MKQITAIVRPSVLEPLKDELMNRGFTGMTVNQTHGYGNQLGWKENYRGHETLVNVIPKLSVMLIVRDEDADSAIEAICSVARTGEVGDGKIFVTTVDEVIRIRTGERGVDALQ